MQLFPKRIINIWNKCEVRAIVLLSLVLQIILIILGKRRKLTASFWIRIIVWSAYMSADWVATVALGNLASTIEDSEDSIHVPNNALQEFWAPFLLFHLGGPDTITAYSLEDNELWKRHFVGLIIQVVVAFYVFLRSWDNSALTFITIPIFISGVIKYGERTYALMSSSEHFEDSQPLSPDRCPDFVKYTGVEESGESEEEEEAMVIPRGKRAEGGSSSSEEASVIPQDDIHTEDMVIPRGKRAEGATSSSSKEEEARIIPQDGIHTEDHNLVLAYFLFNRTKIFFAEGTLNTYEQKCIYSIIKNKSTAEAFELVAVELGLMYDVLYTKAAIVYSHLGIILRCITFFFSVSSLVIFSTIIDTHVYPITDISISYLLLVGAVLLELYELIIFFLTDWAKLCLIKLRRAQNNSLSKTLADLFYRFFGHSLSLLTNTKRWSESMGQYNLISSCLEVQPAYFGVQQLPFMGKLLERSYLTWIDVNSDHLQEKIIGYIKKLDAELDDEDDMSSLRRRDFILRRRGDFALREWYGFSKLTSEWCTINVEFVDSLIMWHIATDICFHDDHDDIDSDCKIGKYLSDYMLYLAFHPFMLPKAKGIGEIRFKKTRKQIIKILKKSNQLHDTHSKSQGACKALLQNFDDLLQNFYHLLQNFDDLDENDANDFNELFKGKSQSLLKYGLMLYKQLQNEPTEIKWKIIRDVWIEMLLYAAHNCGWKQHAQQLRKGGELLTHVCLLMAHFGLNKQYVSIKLLGFTPDMKNTGR